MNMTAKRDQKSLIRDRMAKTGESYTTARRHVVTGEESIERPSGGSTDWKVVRGLWRRLQELVGELDRGSCFSPRKPEPGVTAPEGMLHLDDEWRLALVSTVGLLAEHLRIRFGSDIHPDWARFSWATPDSISENPYVVMARRLIGVTKSLLAAIDAN
jgi:hypothetical protein